MPTSGPSAADADSGVLAESPAVNAAPSTTDSGALAESPAVSTTASTTDSGSSSPSASVRVISADLIPADAGSVSSVATVSVAVAATDSGAATPTPGFAWTATDSGTATPTAQVAEVHVGADSGVGSEAVALTASILGIPPATVVNPTVGSGAALPYVDDSAPMAYDGNGHLYYLSGTELLRYDIAAASWSSPLASAPVPQWEGGAAWFNGKFHVFGGGNFDTHPHQAYDPGTDTWATLSAIPVLSTLQPDSETRQTRAAIGSDGHLYVSVDAYYDDTAAIQTIRLLRYNPGSDTFTELSRNPAIASWGVIGADANGHLYYFDGWNSSDPTGAVWQYTIATDTWALMGGVDPNPTEDMAVGFMAGAFYLFGGDDSSSEEVQGNIRAYDPGTDTFSVVGTMAVPRSDMSYAMVGGTLYLVGGWQGQSGSFDRVDTVDTFTAEVPYDSGEYAPGVDHATGSESAYASPVVVSPVSGTSSHYNKWVLLDPGGQLAQYEFEVNPNRMSDPHSRKETTSLGISPITNISRGARKNRLAPREWTFSGITKSQAQQDAFLNWFALDRKVWLRDHFGRVWLVRLKKYDVQPRKPSSQNTFWRMQYTFTANVYQRIS